MPTTTNYSSPSVQSTLVSNYSFQTRRPWLKTYCSCSCCRTDNIPAIQPLPSCVTTCRNGCGVNFALRRHLDYLYGFGGKPLGI